MAAKADPKDDRIAELELQLEAAGKAIQDAEAKAQGIDALKAQLDAAIDRLATKDKELAAAKLELETLKLATGTQARATVTGLDGSKAVQLKVSCVITNGLNGARIDAVAGDVLALKDDFAAISTKVGGAAKVHPVTKEELEATKQSGRCY